MKRISLLRNGKGLSLLLVGLLAIVAVSALIVFAANIVGDKDPNNLAGTNNPDLITGLEKTDCLAPLDGRDVLYAGPDDDSIVQTASGEVGGDKFIDLGQGDDCAPYAATSGVLPGPQKEFKIGTETYHYGPTSCYNCSDDTPSWTTTLQDNPNLKGNDTILGGPGDDYIFGGDGNDYIDGGSDAAASYGDYLRGGDGNDTILPGKNDHAGDYVDAGDGNDLIIIRAGDVPAGETTYIDCGAGADTVIFLGFGNQIFDIDNDGDLDDVTDPVTGGIYKFDFDPGTGTVEDSCEVGIGS